MAAIYSFADLSVVFAHPSLGQYLASGTGIGTITFSMTTDRSVQDVGADGSIMTSKVEGENGTVAIAIQQTSALNAWLLNAYNYLKTADASEWNEMTLTCDAAVMGDQNQLTGCSFQKKADRPYQAQGQQITWTVLAETLFST